MKSPTRSAVLRLGLIVPVLVLAACTQQDAALPPAPSRYVEENPLRLIESDGRARGYELAQASQCGGDPKRIMAARLAAMPRARTDVESKAVYQKALAENFERVMREDRMNDQTCDTAHVQRQTADLFPQPPDPMKTSRIDRERYDAELEQRKERQARRETAMAATRAEEAREMQIRQASDQQEQLQSQQERLYRMQALQSLQNMQYQQNLQQQQNQQQNMNNLQQFNQSRSTFRPPTTCFSTPMGAGSYSTSCN